MSKILIDEAAVRQALNKAFQLGQRYWSWADSEYSSHWKKADAAKAEFDQLVQDTINSSLAEQPAQQEPYGQVTVVRRPGCADQHWFYRWPNAPYLDNAAECHVVHTTPQPAQRKPLTNEFLEALAEKHVTNCYFDTLAYARAIEIEVSKNI